MDDWKKLSKDSKGHLVGEDGKKFRTALWLIPGEGTCLVAVEIVKRFVVRDKGPGIAC